MPDGTPDLPTLLRDYEGYGALAVTWRMFGSSERPTQRRRCLWCPAGLGVEGGRTGCVDVFAKQPGCNNVLQTSVQPFACHACSSPLGSPTPLLADGHLTRQPHVLSAYTSCLDAKVCVCVWWGGGGVGWGGGGGKGGGGTRERCLPPLRTPCGKPC